MGDIDKYTFQFADVSDYPASAKAFAKVSIEFIRSLKNTKRYQSILQASLDDLLEKKDHLTEASLKVLIKSMSARQNEILRLEREKDKSRIIKGHKPREEEEEEDDDELEEDPTTAAEREAEELRKEKEMEAARILEEQREAEREQFRMENEARLKAKARKVDDSILEDLKNQGLLLHDQTQKEKKQNGAQDQVNTDSISALEAEIAQVMAEKNFIQDALDQQIADPAKRLETLQKALAEAPKQMGAANGNAEASNKKPLKPNQIKSQVAQLQQKLTKQRTEKNRLTLRLKAAITELSDSLKGDDENN